MDDDGPLDLAKAVGGPPPAAASVNKALKPTRAKDYKRGETTKTGKKSSAGFAAGLGEMPA